VPALLERVPTVHRPVRMEPGQKRSLGEAVAPCAGAAGAEVLALTEGDAGPEQRDRTIALAPPLPQAFPIMSCTPPCKIRHTLR
jgi:hypothetical protein